MSGLEDQKQQVITELLENAALTDGLSDEDAQHLLDWCEARVTGFTPTAESSLVDYGQHLARQARLITRIATHIEDGDSRDRIEQHLQQLTDDSEHRTDFLALLDEPRPTHDYLQALCRIATGLSLNHRRI